MRVVFLKLSNMRNSFLWVLIQEEQQGLQGKGGGVGGGGGVPGRLWIQGKEKEKAKRLIKSSYLIFIMWTLAHYF